MIPFQHPHCPFFFLKALLILHIPQRAPLVGPDQGHILAPSSYALLLKEGDNVPPRTIPTRYKGAIQALSKTHQVLD